jgi:hypothetical protein
MLWEQMVEVNETSRKSSSQACQGRKGFVCSTSTQLASNGPGALHRAELQTRRNVTVHLLP